jgi:hypothetical protein
VSRATVRAAVADYFNAYEVPGVTAFLAYPSKVLSFNDPRQTGPTKCYVEIGMPSSRETRTAVGGPTDGIKRIEHTVTLAIKLHSVKRRLEEVVADYDGVVDAIYVAIRADRQFANPAVVWQAGVWQITDRMDEPQLDDDSTLIQGEITFPITEFIHG